MVAISLETRGNSYLYSLSRNQFLLTHPILRYLVDRGQQDDQALDQALAAAAAEGVAGHGPCTAEQLRYYEAFFRLLRAHGYFADLDPDRDLHAQMTPARAEQLLPRTAILTFEATTRCNLRCKYCGFGEFYRDKRHADHRRHALASLDAARHLVDHVMGLAGGGHEALGLPPLIVAFYGGEPLLNFPFVQQVVRHCQQMRRHGRWSRPVRFRMTTNGVLLHRHLPFLVENDFYLDISIDGDEEHNSYRVMQDGQPSFAQVHGNILQLKERYADYFQRRVEFISVMHDRNDPQQTRAFIRQRYGKLAICLNVNNDLIVPERREEFSRMFPRYNVEEAWGQPLDHLGCDPLASPQWRRLDRFLQQRFASFFQNFDQLFSCHARPAGRRVITGTCPPFLRGLFMDCGGQLFICERVPRNHPLGQVTAAGVQIDFSAVADLYNKFYGALIQECARCARVHECPLCFFAQEPSFFAQVEQGEVRCPRRQSEAALGRQLERELGLLEQQPGLYALLDREEFR